MMMGRLLLRGMLAGLIAACLAAIVAGWLGEPQITSAIAFEELHHHGADDIELVSRAVQKTFGLTVALWAYGAAFGGIFSIFFAALYGRVQAVKFSPRALSLVLAIAGFVVFVIVPDIKYAPNPPAIGQAATIGLRTAAYFEMMLLSFCGAVLGFLLALRLLKTTSGWNAALISGFFFIFFIFLVHSVLPEFSEIPEGFPAHVLWQFRLASIAMQAVLWASMGILFGIFAEKTLKFPIMRLK